MDEAGGEMSQKASEIQTKNVRVAWFAGEEVKCLEFSIRPGDTATQILEEAGFDPHQYRLINPGVDELFRSSDVVFPKVMAGECLHVIERAIVCKGSSPFC